MAPDNRCCDDTMTPTAVRYGGTSTATYTVNCYHKEEEPEDFYEREDFEYRKMEERFAAANFNNALPSKAFFKRVEIKQKRFKQKVR